MESHDARLWKVRSQVGERSIKKLRARCVQAKAASTAGITSRGLSRPRMSASDVTGGEMADADCSWIRKVTRIQAAI